MYSRLLSLWKSYYEEAFAQSTWVQRLAERDLSLSHYKGLLLETYHHAGLNPQIQAFSTFYMDRHLHKLQKMFFQHATSEIGHDELALNDLIALGEDEKTMRSYVPLPETIAFNAYVIYKIQFENPISYLGYLFHLEYLPMKHGASYIESLKLIGVPDEALSFIKDHSTVDMGHTRLMEHNYVQTLVKDEATFEVVSRTMYDSCRLHLNMIEAAFKNGEKIFP